MAADTVPALFGKHLAWEPKVGKSGDCPDDRLTVQDAGGIKRQRRPALLRAGTLLMRKSDQF